MTSKKGDCHIRQMNVENTLYSEEQTKKQRCERGKRKV